MSLSAVQKILNKGKLNDKSFISSKDSENWHENSLTITYLPLQYHIEYCKVTWVYVINLCITIKESERNIEKLPMNCQLHCLSKNTLSLSFYRVYRQNTHTRFYRNLIYRR